MNFAQKIVNKHSQDTYKQQAALESELDEICVRQVHHNCFDRDWIFYDGSKASKTRDGIVAE